jgi:hypothetical protein
MMNLDPPTNLESQEAKDFWREIVEIYNENLLPHHIALLRAACRILDRANQAAAEVKAKKPYSKDRHGRWVAHPGLTVESRSLAQFARLMKAMGVGYAQKSGAGRPEEGAL